MAIGQWSEVEARGVLAAWKRNEMSLQQYAKERGFVPQRLRYWRQKIDRADAAVGVKLPAILPVKLTSEPARRGEPVTVLLRTGHMLKVSHGFDEDAFARVVALLEGR